MKDVCELFFSPMYRDTRKKCFYSQTELITWKIKFDSVPPVATHSLRECTAQCVRFTRTDVRLASKPLHL